MTTTAWRKSTRSFSNSNCLEADGPWAKASGSFSNSNCLEARWAKSSHSGAANCVQVRLWALLRRPSGRMVVRVRDSKLGDASPVLEFTPGAWAAFTGRVKAGAA